MVLESLSDRIRGHALCTPGRLAIADDGVELSYSALDLLLDRVAAALQRDGVDPGRVVASVAEPNVAQTLVFLGALRAGCVAAPLQPSATAAQIASMLADADANMTFLDAPATAALAGERLPGRIVALAELEQWLTAADARPKPVAVSPEDGFNIIYSSGTTGTPKGIVQSHAMRASQFASYAPIGFGEAVTLIATPLYSNTTLVSLLPTLFYGGGVVLMRRFNARRYLELAERYRATHTMLVPVQYSRIMALPEFERFDLSAFRFKTSTSAPFAATLKADVIARWPGRLIEFYGMTEGGGSTVLDATAHPDKLATVGKPAPGHDIRLVGEDERELPVGEIGEVVSRSDAMMRGYHGRQVATEDAIWIDPKGAPFIRHGDIGRFDRDGFLTLLDRKKDMIISGGFNIYPSDLEAVLSRHPDVVECAVVGMPSAQWGETPVGFYVAAAGTSTDPVSILADTNELLGKTQRLAALHALAELPRSAIGKVLKRELRETLAAEAQV